MKTMKFGMSKMGETKALRQKMPLPRTSTTTALRTKARHPRSRLTGKKAKKLSFGIT